MLDIRHLLLQEEGQLVAEWSENLLVEMIESEEASAPLLGKEKLLVNLLLVREVHRLKKRGEMSVRSVNNTPIKHKILADKLILTRYSSSRIAIIPTLWT